MKSPAALPESLISASIIICERVMEEKDGVLSAFRMADVFFYGLNPEIPLEKHIIQMTLLGTGKFSPEDTTDHVCQFGITRPNGEYGTLTEEPIPVPVAPTIRPGVPRGFNLIVQLAIVPKQTGTHYAHLTMDGQEIARSPFTLLLKAEDAESKTP